MQLKINKNVTMAKGDTWEQAIVHVGKVGTIHIHNNTQTGEWIYFINTVNQIHGKVFGSGQAAYSAALNEFSELLSEAQKELLAACEKLEGEKE